jgi:hypothetical protein
MSFCAAALLEPGTGEPGTSFATPGPGLPLGSKF